jgi:hypothetical protein
MSAAREATAQELELLWSAVADGDYVEDASDGHLQWAFLLDFWRQGAAALFPGLTGAVLYAENDVGPTGAWLYSGRDQLAQAWLAAFATRPATRSCR